MPTGYTADVQDGTITELRDYAMGCARAFGALIDMRDDPKAAEVRDLEPDGYYANRVAQLNQEMAEAVSRTPKQWADLAEKVYRDAVDARDKYAAQQEEGRGRYERMLEKARAYTPPTPGHKKFAEFMVEQLEKSIAFDCGGMEFYPEPVRYSGEAYRAKEIERIGGALKPAVESRDKEIERCNERNAWVAALRESLA